MGKIFILDSRYITKPSFSAVRLIACMIGTKSTYTPSTALLVDSQRVLKAFRTFFATIMISKKLILEAKNTNNLPPVSNYELDLTNIRNAPATSVIHARIFANSSRINNHHVIRGHRELKKKLRGNCPKRKKPDNITQETMHWLYHVPKKCVEIHCPGTPPL